MESLLTQMLEEQRKTNQLLSNLIATNNQLIAALSDDSGDDADQPLPLAYLDGTPCP